MATKKPSIQKLSSATMDLKFMKRSKEQFEKQEEDEERRQLYKEQLDTLHDSADRIVLMPSHYDLQTYLPCRLSFGGMEPSIEKLNQPKLTGLYKVDMPPEDTREMQTDFTDLEMAKHFEEIRGKTVGRFVKRKSDQNSQPRKKFKIPKEEPEDFEDTEEIDTKDVKS